jgi:hypothetical protein
MSRREVLATTAAAGVVTAPTAATAAPEKAAISLAIRMTRPRGKIIAKFPRSKLEIVPV